MKNQIKNKNIIFPWDIRGYIKLNKYAKDRILEFLINKHRFKSDIAKTLDVPEHWIYNFIRTEKIDDNTFEKIVNLMGDNDLIKEVIQFNDDKGSSSVPFVGKFPVKYSPIWHFIFCLSVGDGYIHKGNKKRFDWYQKPEGLREVVKLINKMGFEYSPHITTCKRGIVIPQMIRKVGEHATGLSTNYEIKNNIIEASSELGKDYEIAFIAAFFMDESGMGKLKNNSEITIHQEGNLNFLEKFGKLLDKFGISWSKNKKGNEWNIRLRTTGVVKLAEVLNSVKKHGVTLLHREEIFHKKVEVAKRTSCKSQLKLESKKLRTYILNKYSGKQINLAQIRKHFKSNRNLSIRLRDLIYHMKKKNELINVGLAKYQVRGDKNEN